MAEASNGESKKYGKLLQRNFSRTLERVKSTLGKTDKTSDEEFDRLSLIFKEQQAAANRLQRGLKAYMTHANAMAGATEDLYLAMRDAYELDWEGSKTFREKAEKAPAIRDGFLNVMHERAVFRMNNYNAQFPPVKTLIAKRSRKMVDYDAARHRKRSLEGAKKRNESKINQANDNLMTTKHVYERINQDLLRELPKLYDSRVLSLCSCFEVLLNTEQEYSARFSTLNKEMAEIVSAMHARALEEAQQRNSTSNRNAEEKQANNGHYATQSEAPPEAQPDTIPEDEQNNCEHTEQPNNINKHISTAELKKDYLQASYSPPLHSTDKNLTNIDKSFQGEKHPHPTRPATGPTGFGSGRPGVNVVADVHKDNPMNASSAGKSSIQQSSSVTFSSTSKDDGSQSPAVVQQQMMLKKRHEEELLKQQMLRQKQQEEYLKHQQQQQQLYRQQELQRREEEVMIKHRQQQQLKLQQQKSSEKKDEPSEKTVNVESKDEAAVTSTAINTVTVCTSTSSCTAETTGAGSTANKDNASSIATPINVNSNATDVMEEIANDATSISNNCAESVTISTGNTVNEASTLNNSADSVATPSATTAVCDSSVAIANAKTTYEEANPFSSSVASEIATNSSAPDKKDSITGSSEATNNETAVVDSTAATVQGSDTATNSQTSELSSQDSKPSHSQGDLATIMESSVENSKDVVLYSVVAINEYTGEDNEELSLEPGNVINVFQLRPDQEPLDDGWLYGLNTATKVRGLFPANFTKKL